MHISPTIFYFLILFVLSGCTRIYYAPTTQNVPLLTEANELRILGGEAVDDDTEYSMFDIQASYSPIKHIGFMANTYWGARESDDLFKISLPNTGNLTEFGVGLYFPLQDSFTVESYAGYGQGSITYAWTFDTIAAVKFNKSFVQFSFGFKSKYFELAITERLSYLTFTNVGELNEIYSYSNVPQENGIYIFNEPSFTMRAGIPLIKFSAIAGQVPIGRGRN